jgi:hypothetical protein
MIFCPKILRKDIYKQFWDKIEAIGRFEKDRPFTSLHLFKSNTLTNKLLKTANLPHFKVI